MAAMEMSGGFSGMYAEHPALRSATLAIGGTLVFLTAACGGSETAAPRPLPSATASPNPGEASPSPSPEATQAAPRFTGNPAGNEWRTSPELAGQGELPGVKYDQELLIAGGCSAGVADGFIEAADSYTIRAVERAQAALGVEVDGYFGPASRTPAEAKVNAGQPVCDSPEPKRGVQGAAFTPEAPADEAPAATPAGCGGNVQGPGVPGTECPDGSVIGTADSPGCGKVYGPPTVKTRCPDGQIVG